MHSTEKRQQDGGRKEAEEGVEAQEVETPCNPALTRVEDHRPEGYSGDCLRPMGLCELGGCCDLCWYGNPALRRAGAKDEGA